MAKNLIPEVCKLLGVEVGEEFKTKTNNQVFYKIDSDGTVNYLCKNEWLKSARELTDLLNGELEIVKLPWKPKFKEEYYSFGMICNGESEPFVGIKMFYWSNTPQELAMYKAGWIYRTREEAEAALPKVAEELRVKYEL